MKEPLGDSDAARKFVEERRMTRKEIKLVRRMMKIGNLIPGFRGKITPAVKEEIEKILVKKEQEIQ